MNLKNFFKLDELGTDVKTEVVAGVTTFLTMAYIIFVNASIVSKTGMSFLGLFATTILATVIGTLIMSLYVKVPLAVSTGMGINACFTYTLCLGMGYHWKECLAIIFISGIVNAVICFTGASRKIAIGIPKSFNYAITAAIGMFIAYTGIKNAKFLLFSADSGSYTASAAGDLVLDSSALPQFATSFTNEQLVAFISFFTILIFLALERRNKESYGAFLMGVLIASFAGISLGVTNLSELKLFDMSSVSEVPQMLFSFFGNPGLLSIFSSASKSVTTIVMIGFFTLLFILNAYATIIGTGRFNDTKIFSDEEYDAFQESKTADTKVKRAIRSNSVAIMISPLLGTTPATTFIESATGITAGGKSGLTSFVVAILFLLCLPFAGILQLIPSAAIAPTLIIAGCFLMTCLKNIDWSDFPTAIGCATILLFVTLAYSIVDGIMIGFIVYLLLSIMGKRYREVNPVITIFCIGYIVLMVAQKLLA